jgi:hypothetical protein
MTEKLDKSVPNVQCQERLRALYIVQGIKYQEFRKNVYD